MSLTICGLQMQAPPPDWPLRRRPKCNRVSNHEGAHREYDKNSYRVRAEWTDEEARVS
jgi:hypothetical protein